LLAISRQKSEAAIINCGKLKSIFKRQHGFVSDRLPMFFETREITDRINYEKIGRGGDGSIGITGQREY
jgi:hypothetical protein